MSLKLITLPGAIGLIEVKDTLLSEEESDELRKAVREFLDRRWHRLVIDLTGVRYISSIAVGVLVSAHASYTNRGWQIRFCGLSDYVRHFLAVTNLGKVFAIFDTREEALKSIVPRKEMPGKVADDSAIAQ